MKDKKRETETEFLRAALRWALIILLIVSGIAGYLVGINIG